MLQFAQNRNKTQCECNFFYIKPHDLLFKKILIYPNKLKKIMKNCTCGVPTFLHDWIMTAVI